ncbi:MAG: hypothetical protein ACE5ID_05295, partial [Acidobacteriota bacterium]
ALDRARPPGAPLLAAGWFQRSVAYYLKRRGRQVRMFPGNREGKKVAAMNRSGSLYIAYQEPAPPGVQELLAAGASLRTLARVDGLKSPLVLVEIRPEVPFPSQR